MGKLGSFGQLINILDKVKTTKGRAGQIKHYKRAEYKKIRLNNSVFQTVSDSSHKQSPGQCCRRPSVRNLPKCLTKISSSKALGRFSFS